MNRLTLMAMCLVSVSATACATSAGAGSQSGALGQDASQSTDGTQADGTSTNTAADAPTADTTAQDTAQACPIPTFAKDVHPILKQDCASCHSMWVDDEKAVKQRIKTILFNLDKGIMPPPAPAKSEPYPAPTAADKAVLKAWSDGTPLCPAP
jgi:hypothetical protein